MTCVFKEIRAGIPPERIIVGGFSMGGALALYAGLTYDKPLGGILGLSSFLVQRMKIPGVSFRQDYSDQIFEENIKYVLANILESKYRVARNTKSTILVTKLLAQKLKSETAGNTLLIQRAIYKTNSKQQCKRWNITVKIHKYQQIYLKKLYLILLYLRIILGTVIAQKETFGLKVSRKIAFVKYWVAATVLWLF